MKNFPNKKMMSSPRSVVLLLHNFVLLSFRDVLLSFLCLLVSLEKIFPVKMDTLEKVKVS